MPAPDPELVAARIAARLAHMKADALEVAIRRDRMPPPRRLSEAARDLLRRAEEIRRSWRGEP
jgi:hypothetical protein